MTYDRTVVKNDGRRRQLADAAVAVLANEGARGLTHRAIDRAAEVPNGTTSNYFSDRDAIIVAILERIGSRLAPPSSPVIGRSGTGRAGFAAYMRELVERLTSDRDAALALFELRLEATRRPVVHDTLAHWLRSGLDADVAFHLEEALPGDREHVVLFHYAITGLVLDQLTVPIDPGADPGAAIARLTDGLLPER
jgi:DNA-binding transcriptional regulator YbjK